MGEMITAHIRTTENIVDLGIIVIPGGHLHVLNLIERLLPNEGGTHITVH